MIHLKYLLIDRIWQLFLITIIILTELNNKTYGWYLSQLNLNNQYKVLHVSVFYVRAFLCISSQNSSTNPTLIETTWPENLLPIKPKIYPNELYHSHGSSDCNAINQAIQTSIDMTSGELWVLDNGSKYCSPKLISFDLLRRNEYVNRYSFSSFAGNTFTSFKLAPDIHGSRNTSRLFITLKDKDFIIAYASNEQRWWKLKLIKNDMIVVPKDIAFANNGYMYITDLVNNLWLIPQAIQTSVKRMKRRSNYFELDVILVAHLLGDANTIIADPMDMLYYFMPKDGAVVRWNSRKSLKAENHDVLYFSSKTIVQIMFGVKGSVWTVEPTANENGDHCKRILSHYTSTSVFDNSIY